MKEQKNIIKTISSREKLENIREKKSYEKPRLATVTLFADQVMGNCNVPGPASGCNIPINS